MLVNTMIVHASEPMLRNNIREVYMSASIYALIKEDAGDGDVSEQLQIYEDEYEIDQKELLAAAKYRNDESNTHTHTHTHTHTTRSLSLSLHLGIWRW
jgi:hypothetical protein